MGAKRTKVGLKERVLHAKLKRNKRMMTNYHLARAYGYSAEESSIVMNQGWRNIIANAYVDGRRLIRGRMMPTEYVSYANAVHKKYHGHNLEEYFNLKDGKAAKQPKDVTEIGAKK